MLLAEGPLPDLVIDRCSTLFLQGCVAVNPQDVVDAADSQTFPKEGKFRLRVLAKLDAFVRIRLAEELQAGSLLIPAIWPHGLLAIAVPL